METASSTVIAETVSNPTAWGVAVVIAILTYWFFRDVKNPEKAASNTILSGMVSHTADVFRMAQVAMNEATKAQALALESARTNIRCEQRVADLVAYNRTLTGQLVEAGITPAPLPQSLLTDD